MANPQPTDSHLRVSNQIAEALVRFNLSKPHLDIVFFIMRLSWGCGKPSACIPDKKDFTLCGVGAGHVAEKLRQLIEAKVIIADPPHYQIQKDFDLWQISAGNGWNKTRFDDLVSQNIKFQSPDLRQTTDSPRKGEAPARGEKLPGEGRNSPQTGETPLPLEGSRSPQTGAESGEKPSAAGLRKVRITRRSFISSTTTTTTTPAHEEEVSPWDAFEQEFRRSLSGMEIQRMLDWLNGNEKTKRLSPCLIVRGLKEASLHGKLNFAYIDTCLLNWTKKGWLTAADVDAGKEAEKKRNPPQQFGNRSPQPNLSVVPGGGAGSKGQRDRDRLEAARRRAMAGGQ